MGSVLTDRPPMPAPVQVALLVVVLGALLGVASMASPELLGTALCLCVVVLAWGWAGMLGLPAPRGTSVVLLAGGSAVVVAALAGDGRPELTWVPGALSVAVIVAFVHQLVRVDGRPRIVESVSSVVMALALVTCGVTLLPLVHTSAGVAVAVGALAAGAASAVTDTLGRWEAMRVWLLPLALVSGGAAATLVAVVMGQQWGVYVLIGVTSGAVSHAARSVLCVLPTMAHVRPRVVMSVASLLVTGPVAYVSALALLPAVPLTL